MDLLVSLVLLWIAPIFVAHKLGAPKGRMGWLWGLVLGWIGVIVVALLSDKKLQYAR